MIGDWQTFFATAGGAAATLAGLLFVGTSLQVRRIVSVPSLLAMSTETTLEFGLVLLGSLLLVMAVDGWATGVPLAALGALMAVASLLDRKRARDRGPMSVRLLLPAVCGLVVVAGAISLALGWRWAPYVLALTMVALLGLGLRNALDLLLQMDDGEADARVKEPRRPASARRRGPAGPS